MKAQVPLLNVLHTALITACLLIVAPATAEDITPGLRGTWSVEVMERGAKKPPEELLKTAKVIIRGDTLEFSDGKRSEIGKFTLDRGEKPVAIDVEFNEGLDGNVKRTALGILELDNDVLKLAWRKDGGARPKEFSSIAGERTSELLILRRTKD